MAITVPSAGDSITATYGAAVANQLNLYASAVLSADVSKAASSWSDITGLTFSVTSGLDYTIWGFGTWTNSAGGGLRIGFNHPGGNVRGITELAGETDALTLTREWHTVVDDSAGVSTVDTNATARLWIVWARYQCTSNGTFALRYYREGAGTTAIQQGSGIWAVCNS